MVGKNPLGPGWKFRFLIKSDGIETTSKKDPSARVPRSFKRLIRSTHELDCRSALGDNVAAVTVITAVAMVGYYDAALVTYSHPHTQQDKDLADSSDANEADGETLNLVGDAILAIESDSFFTGQGTKALRKIVEALEAKDYVSDVVWLDEIPMPNAFSIPAPILPHESASPESFENAKQKALDHPIIGGLFLSDDAKTLLMMVEFDFLFVQTDENCCEDLRTTAEQAVAEFSDVDFKFGVTGAIPFYVTARKTQGANQFFYQAIGYSMIAIMAVILFRGFAAVFVVAIAPAMGVFWTLGIIRFFDMHGNPFNDVVLPVLVSLVWFDRWRSPDGPNSQASLGGT